MTEEQDKVLMAALELCAGGLDMREVLNCYATISKYVNDHPPIEPNDE